MRNVHYGTGAIAGLSVAAVLALSGCSDNSTASQTASPASPDRATSVATTVQATPAANLVGPDCAAYAQQVPTGPGSVEGMAMDPVTVAASNNPMLKTLTQAVSGQLNPDVNLVDTLNGAEFTVFAPTDAAFAKLPPETVETLKTDANLLTSILTYHVVPGQATPDKVVGTHATVQGAELTVTGSGDDLRVNDAGVVCGGVDTANAQVYMIDTVLMPPMSTN